MLTKCVIKIPDCIGARDQARASCDEAFILLSFAILFLWERNMRRCFEMEITGANLCRYNRIVHRGGHTSSMNLIVNCLRKRNFFLAPPTDKSIKVIQAHPLYSFYFDESTTPIGVCYRLRCMRCAITSRKLFKFLQTSNNTC